MEIAGSGQAKNVPIGDTQYLAIRVADVFTPQPQGKQIAKSIIGIQGGSEPVGIVTFCNCVGLGSRIYAKPQSLSGLEGSCQVNLMAGNIRSQRISFKILYGRQLINIFLSCHYNWACEGTH